MVTFRVVSDLLFSSLDLFCPAPHERPLAAASFRDLGWLAAISFCIARDDSLSLVSLHSASRANRLPSFELLELYVGPVTLVHPPCSSNKTMPFRPFDKTQDLQQAQGPEVAAGQPTQHFVATTKTTRSFIFKVLGG